MTILEQTLAAIRPADPEAVAEARAHQDRLTKPRGALGALEEVAVRLAGAAAASPPPIPAPAALAIFAADHGVHAQGVSPWPQEVTQQMVGNFLAGGAVANAFAAQVGATVTVVDVGVAADLPPAPNLIVDKVAYGTADLSEGPAMTPAQAVSALEAGIAVARRLVDQGARCLVTGDMGIANTTASAALICAFTGRDAAEATGRGTGVDDETLTRKVEIVRRALLVNGLAGPAGGRSGDAGEGRIAGGDVAAGPERSGGLPAGDALTGPALRTLAAVGGLEHAAIAGFILGAASLRVPVILDGVIAGSAALAAAALAPDAVDHCVAGHRSAEPGHALALAHLGLRPLVELELRLGEGTGGLLAHPLVCAAVRVMHEVATFDSAGVTEKGA
ncbi:nicotinate-nucleotide--dimethylbenzimidazole phosphoribosyltransferase [Planomonospora parontospora]|uniref:nicotinate-nucleotide--dimethylbenzimidazole phosphoribosyltransferase n=1 Tax=Planomonospora parontospora TaxID=58119 RepID=UPI0016713D49|nr:nicotinate-nucleotide--dimethylbenzimidazole phosphoribosyltransferase [Planomonospora parontospora]GGL44227.1 nicotinate-nucleotide--dimethylbenzimidazole phosphoribosyltransferase [Planomonospora parontospora subsp. antibiotica]GII18599.1 nicotinate-nucleotide--dimethylbenzimidazole phosphoribosyltransferase [Planomonospora parontospora subsp. antibiotica]